MAVPEKPQLEELENRWSQSWESAAIYRFDRSAPRDQVYSIDTPPPTVSGSLHMGHVFSYVQTDAIARYQRMKGKTVFYPMGWDDNGLPTERRVQNHYGIRCEPELPYDPSFQPPVTPGKALMPCSRKSFIALCDQLTQQDERAFEALWRKLGLSVDWTLTYSTIGLRARRASQRAFLRLLRAGHAYQAEAPTLWDIDFRTAVAQAELEDRETTGAYHRVRFEGIGEKPRLLVDTTRPELLPACVALVAHPDDPRYQPLFGGKAKVPLFGQEVPILSHPLAKPDKGTGLVMVCTFGDVTDVIWWRELRLPLRAIVGRDGRLATTPPSGVHAGPYREVAGKTCKQAQIRMVELLRESGDLIGEVRAIMHPVKYYEKGDRPLEVIPSRQWFIRTLPLREALKARGAQLQWHPEPMQARYEAWVEGLNTDWLVSRQRYFGVPFPLWYRLNEQGLPIHDAPIVPNETRLPVDPASDVPAGFTETQRGRPGGFVGDPDVMDTWATSSLSPQIAGGWEEDDDFFHRMFPMDLRPQAHEIIRTWLFYTVVRSHIEHGVLPWRHVAISGWVMDPDRKKMSKSKGKAVTPAKLIEQYGADALRFWACSARLGTDTLFDEGQLRIGRRLAMKLMNASRFVLTPMTPAGAVKHPLDRAWISRLADVVEEATASFETLDSARALQRVEAFFWDFCDNYLELVKPRAYGALGAEEASSAFAALRLGLSTLLRLFAPLLPFVTEEVWSWSNPGSIHKAPWPEASELRTAVGSCDDALYDEAIAVLGAIRKAKSEISASLKSRATQVRVRAPAARHVALQSLASDLQQAGNVGHWIWEDGPTLEVQVLLER